MRDLNSSDKTVQVTIIDPFTEDEHLFSVRIPTSSEIGKYTAQMMSRRGKRIISNMYQHNVKFAKKILMSIDSPTIGIDGVALSSDPNDPGYRENWRNLLEQKAPELLAPIGTKFYAGANIETMDEDEEEEDEEKSG